MAFSPLQSARSAVDLVLLTLVTLVRMGASNFRAGGVEQCQRPATPLVLYEYQGCPFCRKVREAVSVLDLDVLIKPCPRTTFKKDGAVEGSRFRGQAVEKGGKASFPLLIDENRGVVMYESNDIINYLWATYGDKATKPLTYRLATSPLLQWTVFLAAALRTTSGMFSSPSKCPAKPLVLYGFEGSPFVARVAETLCELETPYLFKTVAHGSKAKRKAFIKDFAHLVSSPRKSLGLVMVPLLVDPNTGVCMVESADIVAYLRKTYGLAA